MSPNTKPATDVRELCEESLTIAGTLTDIYLQYGLSFEKVRKGGRKDIVTNNLDR